VSQSMRPSMPVTNRFDHPDHCKRSILPLISQTNTKVMFRSITTTTIKILILSYAEVEVSFGMKEKVNRNGI
jgi:hypothetical protein